MSLPNRQVGDNGHIDDHNTIAEKIATLESALPVAQNALASAESAALSAAAALVSKQEAEAAELEAESAEANALVYSQNASQAAAEAAGYRSSISASLATVQGYVDDVEADALSAALSADLAEDWAIKLDGPVEGGEFSAKYWAQQAIGPGAVTLDGVQTLTNKTMSGLNNTFTDLTADPVDGSVTDAKIVSGGLSASAIAGTAVVDNDSRLSDDRTPLDDSVTSAKIVDGTIVDGDINASAAISPTKVDGQAVVRTELSTALPEDLSTTASAGVATDVARADHVHAIMYDVPAGAISFDTTPTGISDAEGKVYWDTDFNTLGIVMGGGNVSLPVGQKSGAEVTNKSGVTITKGKVVQFDGASGGNLEVDVAVNDGTVNPRLYFGVAAEAILDDEQGFVVDTGYIRGLDTNAWVVGTLLYIGASGDLTNTIPAKPAFRVPIAAVTRQNSTSGVVYVRMNTGVELNEVFDVDIDTPVDGDSFVYDDGVWKNERLPTISYQSTEPASPITGDLWMDSDDTA